MAPAELLLSTPRHFRSRGIEVPDSELHSEVCSLQRRQTLLFPRPDPDPQVHSVPALCLNLEAVPEVGPVVTKCLLSC